jgi:predicted nucleotidyltransferase
MIQGGGFYTVRRLEIQWFELESALEDDSFETSHSVELWPLPPRPPIRSHLLAGVLQFAQAASRLPGVTRMALIGSLTTSEPDPADADVLVSVQDDMELAGLARLGRKLAGHAQNLNRGGDVFLADPRNNYLGRTCPWKACGPGIRVSCDADRCGQRHYLHDDLRTIKLLKAVLTAPPIELWPRVVARVAVPEDVQRELLDLLGQAE